MSRQRISEIERESMRDAMLRIREFASENNLTYTTIARMTRLNARTFFENFELRTVPSAFTLAEIAKFYNLSLNWVMLGIGPHYLTELDNTEEKKDLQVADTFNLHFGSGAQINREYNHPDIIRIHSNVTDSPGASVSQTVTGTQVPGQSGNISSAPSASGLSASVPPSSGQFASVQPSSGQSASVPPSSDQTSGSDIQHQSASGSALPSDAEVIAGLQATVRNLSDTVAQQQVTVRNLSDTVTQQAVANATLSRLIDKLNM